MPQCRHEGHRAQEMPFKNFKGKTETVTMLLGWNPIHRRYEDCDPGLIPPRKPGRKKVLRREAEAR